MIQNFTTYGAFRVFQVWRWATFPDFSPGRGGLRAGPQKVGPWKGLRAFFGPQNGGNIQIAQEGLALRSRWLWRHFFTWPRCRPMRTGIQCCRFVQVPERPTLTPRYFFLRCSIRHAMSSGHQISSWFVGGLYCHLFFPGFSFWEDEQWTSQANHQPVFHRIVATWVLIAHCGPLGHLVGEIEEAFSKTPKKNSRKAVQESHHKSGVQRT